MQASKIRKVVVHCSDSPDTRDIGAAEIRRWHVEGNGWRDIGYHFVVRLTGVVEKGRYENGDPFLASSEMGAHAKGHNADTLAVCRVGRTEAGMPGVQRKALIALLADLCSRLDLEPRDVLGHREIAPESGKTCPNLDMDLLRREIAASLEGAA